MAAQRDDGEGRDAVAAARRELAELRGAVNKERRALEGFRDSALAVEAEIARKREEDRFARETADVQQARLDEIKREVGVEKYVPSPSIYLSSSAVGYLVDLLRLRCWRDLASTESLCFAFTADGRCPSLKPCRPWTTDRSTAPRA